MTNHLLEVFAELLITRVRDTTIIDWDMIVDGRMRNTHAQRVRELLASFDDQEMHVLSRLIPQIVDTTIHYVLWMLEQERIIDVTVNDEGIESLNIRAGSDGLSGELSEWIRRWSTQRSEPLF